MRSARHKEYLAALGLESWTRRCLDATAAGGTGSARPGEAPAGSPLPRSVGAARRRPAGLPTAVALDSAAGRRPGAAVAGSPPASRGLHAVVPPADREAAFDWSQLAERVAACTRCALSATRTRTVFGVGSLQARWLVVGEAPGADEDARGEPFVGRAGQLLNAMLRAIGLAREEVYITNVLKCRPPHNRDPAAAETVQCMPYLERQVALLTPSILLVVGRIAAQTLLQTHEPLSRLRQQVHTFGPSRVPLIVTYHPAYLLRTPADKRKSWEDLKFAREVCARG